MGAVLKYFGGSWTFEYHIGFTMWMVAPLYMHRGKPLIQNIKIDIWIIHVYYLSWI